MTLSYDKAVKEIIGKIINKPIDDIDINKSLNELGVDSIEATDIITKIEQKFDILIETDEANAMLNKKVIDVIQELQGRVSK